MTSAATVAPSAISPAVQHGEALMWGVSAVWLGRIIRCLVRVTEQSGRETLSLSKALDFHRNGIDSPLNSLETVIEFWRAHTLLARIL